MNSNDLAINLLESDPDIKVEAKLVGRGATQDEYSVIATYKGRQAAKASVKTLGKSKLRMAGITVNEEFRRKGIATAIYNHLEASMGRKFVRGLKPTRDGAALWNSPKRTWG